jgi:putative hemolysin
MSTEILLIIGLILANGIFAGTELAILGSKRGRLEQQAEDGSSGARAALTLRDDPDRFLAAVQIGITLIGVLTGAVGGATLASRLAPLLAPLPWIGPFAPQLAFTLIVVLITYLTLVFGELVPKRIALLRSERYATLVAPPMILIARITSPFVSLLAGSSQVVLRLIGLGKASETSVTEDDIRDLVREGTEDGTVNPQEQAFIESIFKFSDRSVRHIMTPRHDVEMLEADAALDDVLDELLESGYSRFPVYEETPDEVIGTVHVRDLLVLYRRDGVAAKVRDALSPPLYVPENSRASTLLTTFRKSRRHMALVVGELGGIEGVVTLEDVLEEIVGEIDDEFDDAHSPPYVQRDDGSYLIDGILPIDELKQLLDVDELPDEETFRFDTLAGFVISLLGSIPSAGDKASWGGWIFEVMDMDNLRVDKVLVMRAPQTVPNLEDSVE